MWLHHPGLAQVVAYAGGGATDGASSGASLAQVGLAQVGLVAQVWRKFGASYS